MNYADSVNGTVNDVSLTYIAAPEPGTCLLFLGGLGVAAAWRRRAKRVR